MGSPWADFRNAIITALRASAALATSYAAGSLTEWAKRVHLGPIDLHALPRLQSLPGVVVGEVDAESDLETFENDNASATIKILCTTPRARFGSALEVYDLARDVAAVIRSSVSGVSGQVNCKINMITSDARAKHVIIDVTAPLTVARATLA